jgi:phosphoglycolate phosphatase-like HAD superfamily hydrolase
VLFDMGHTLVYFDPPEMAVIHAAMREAGIDRSVEEMATAMQAVWGEYYRDANATFPATPDYDRQTQLRLMRGFLHQLGLTVDDELLATYERLVDSRFSRPGAMRTFAEVPDVLAKLREQGYRLGIISNWSWNLRDRVAQAGLNGHFEIVWASFSRPWSRWICQPVARCTWATAMHTTSLGHAAPEWTWLCWTAMETPTHLIVPWSTTCGVYSTCWRSSQASVLRNSSGCYSGCTLNDTLLSRRGQSQGRIRLGLMTLCQCPLYHILFTATGNGSFQFQ